MPSHSQVVLACSSSLVPELCRINKMTRHVLQCTHPRLFINTPRSETKYFEHGINIDR